ncbi:MAG: hypothetical protein IKD53_07320 [Clostridia bacterium]|nr:hypothetical protein [Clostridia bacterium]
MAVKEIGTRFKLEGVQKFKQEMNNCAAAVKVLNSEEKLAEAQFKATGNSEAYAAEKTRILKEQMKQQQAAVEAAEKAIKDLSDQGMKPNDRIMQQWQIRLSNAKTNLSNMQTKLNAVEKEFGEQKTAVKDTKDETEKYNTEMGKVAQGVNLQNTITAIDNLKGHIENITRKAVQAAKAVWDMGADAGKWADDIATAAAQAGVDAETWQSWQYASRFIDTSVQDILKNQQDIDKKFKEGEESSKTYAEAMKEVGVSVRDASGNLRGSREMFWDAIDALHDISDADEQARKATLLFGNDWRTLQPLIQAGSKAYKDMAQQGMEVAVVSNEQVAALGSVDDAVQDMNARFDKLKYESLAAMAPTFETVAQAMSTATTALNEFISSEEGQKALEGLNAALSGIISSFLGEDGGKGTFQKIVEGASGAVEEFTKLLEWISNNGEAVKGILLGIAGTWGGLTVFKEALLVMQLINQFGGSSLGKMLSGGGNGNVPVSAETSNTAVNSVNTTAAMNDSGGAFGRFTTKIGAASVVALAVANYNNQKKTLDALAQEQLDVSDKIAQNQQQLREKGLAIDATWSEAVSRGAAALESKNIAPGIFGPTWGENKPALREAVTYWQDNLDAIQDFLSSDTVKKLRELSADDLIDMGNTKTEGADVSNLYAFVKSVSKEMASSDGAAETAEEASARLETLKTDAESAKTAVQELYKELNEKYGVIQNGQTGQFELLNSDNSADANAGIKLLNELYTKAAELKTKYEEAGKAVPQGLAAGIEEETSTAETAAQSLAEKTVKVVSTKLLINSPSKVMEAMGQNVAIGLANGINSRAGVAVAAAQALANRVTAIMRQALQINSPSKVFEQLGAYTGEGFAIGIERSIAQVDRAAGRMLRAAASASRNAPAGVSAPGWSNNPSAGRTALSGAAGAVPEKVQVTVMVDKDVLAETTVPLVDAMMGARLNAVRR